ncbi:hypothetical protein SAMN05444409_1988 [Epilithonimonas zeae]|uniref:Uncharacterized protein n=1 Tax=Epilithonimonas zeae TaxID=1416779 RepID=A0A1N6GQK7_9FLAO|nr:hypothetical protein SAMN05444409_1988 [Epilithonimonas zeae]
MQFLPAGGNAFLHSFKANIFQKYGNVWIWDVFEKNLLNIIKILLIFKISKEKSRILKREQIVSLNKTSILVINS